jgi:Domain of unknown function (DUF4249)
MKNITSVLALFCMTTLLVSCQETIILDLDQTNSSVVIEGLITNEVGKHYVKISKSSGFYETGATERITNAVVKLSNDRGEEVMLAHNPSGEKKFDGFYFTNPAFKGETGRTYKLSVKIGSQMYEAQDELLAVTKIDSLTYGINDSEEEDPDTEGRIYEALLFTKEPKETKDYYLFKFYRNDTLTYSQETDVYVANDEGIGEKIAGFPSPVYYSLKDTATVEMYSISRNAFLFYNDLLNLLNGDGGMFSPPPANPRTNWSNGALGFFQTSAVSRETIIIKIEK